MRPLATTFAGALVAGALASPARATPSCTWNGATDGPPSLTNVFALEGDACTVSASDIAFQAGPEAPAPLPPSIPYSGFVFLAYKGGTIVSTGDDVSLTSYPYSNSEGEGANDYGVYSVGRSAEGAPSSVTFSGSTKIESNGRGGFGLYASDGGVIAATDIIAVSTCGADATGVVAESGGKVTLSGGGSVVTSGDSAGGLLATGNPSQITASGLMVVTSTPTSPGALAEDAGVIALSGGSVTTFAADSPGLVASGQESKITAGLLAAAGAIVTTFEVSSPGAVAQAGGALDLTGGSLTTFGAGSDGLVGSGTGSTITARGVAVTTGAVPTGEGGAPASDGIGVFASDRGTARLEGGSVTTFGASSPGLSAVGAGAKITTGLFAGAGAIVTTFGSDSPGGAALGGALDLSGGSITTFGMGSDGLVAAGAGSTITTQGVAITTGAGVSPASDSVGVFASNQGAATLDGGSVTTFGAGSPGLYVAGAGAKITTGLFAGAGAIVTTFGSDSPGGAAALGGALDLSGGSITTFGMGSDGLVATGAGSAILAQDVAVTTGAGQTPAANSVGVFASSQGTATLEGGSVTTLGALSAALSAVGSGSKITGAGSIVTTLGSDSPGALAALGGAIDLAGGSIATYGAGALGVLATSGGSASLANLAVATAGADAHGAAAEGVGSTVSLSGSNTILTQGNGAIGLYAGQGGALSGSGGVAVTTSGGVSSATGLGAFGVNADGVGSTINLAAATIKTTGAGSIGLFASDLTGTGAAGAITVTGPLNIQTTNPASTAIALQGAGASLVASGGGTIEAAGGAIAFLGGVNQTATFDNLAISSPAGDLIFADPSVATVNFNGVNANAGLGALIDATGGSVVTLNAANSTLAGAVRTDAASTSTMNLTSGSSWTVTGSSVLTNLSVTQSYVTFAPPTEGGGFKTLTLSNYSGSGAYLTMNAALGGGGSSSDQIIINGGNATGSTLLTIRNVSSFGAQTTGPGIPLVLAVNGGTIAPNAFALADTLVAGAYRYTLVESGDSIYLVSSPTTTPLQMASSINSLGRAQQQALITSQMLSSILLGATEQINCSNCGSAFGSIGSYALGAHGRVSLTPELTAIGGFSYNAYSAPGIEVTNAPTFAGALIYDPINFGRSRPFFEIGGGFVPYEQVRTTRTYPVGPQIAEGVGQSVDRSLSLFARAGWVDRLTPIDEAAVYADISRSWLAAGGFTEGASGVNLFPATVANSIQSLDVARFGGQYTHLFNGKIEANVSAAVAYGFNGRNGALWDVADYGSIGPYPVGNSTWCEWGARLGYRFGQRMVLDAFIIGTFGGEIGKTAHGGLGLRYMF